MPWTWKKSIKSLRQNNLSGVFNTKVAGVFYVKGKEKEYLRMFSVEQVIGNRVSSTHFACMMQHWKNWRRFIKMRVDVIE